MNNTRGFIKPQLNIISKAQRGRCSHRLNKITVVCDDLPVCLPNQPALKRLPLCRGRLYRIDKLAALFVFTTYAVRKSATGRQATPLLGHLRRAGATKQQ